MPCSASSDDNLDYNNSVIPGYATHNPLAGSMNSDMYILNGYSTPCSNSHPVDYNTPYNSYIDSSQLTTHGLNTSCLDPVQPLADNNTHYTLPAVVSISEGSCSSDSEE